MTMPFFEKHDFAFKATEEEAEKIKRWVHRHREVCERSNTVGSPYGDTHFSIVFCPTRCGDLVSVRCGACKAEEHVTDVGAF
jgi:hypothetical protein